MDISTTCFHSWKGTGQLPLTAPVESILPFLFLTYLPSVVSLLASLIWFGVFYWILLYIIIVDYYYFLNTLLCYIVSVWWDTGMFLSYLPYASEKEVGWEAPLSFKLLHKSVGLSSLPDLTCVSQFLHLQHPPRTSGRICWQDHPHTNRFGNTAGGKK